MPWRYYSPPTDGTAFFGAIWLSVDDGPSRWVYGVFHVGTDGHLGRVDASAWYGPVSLLEIAWMPIVIPKRRPARGLL